MAKKTGIHSKRIAWDSVAFDIPDNWELAVYRFPGKGITQVEIEDEYAVRLEASWTRPRKPRHMDRILARYEERSKRLTTRADRQKPIPDLPQGWVATHHLFSETAPGAGGQGLKVVKHSLVTAFYIAPEGGFFCFLLLHFLPEDREDPAATMRLVAEGFQHRFEGDLAPWQLFDIAFELPRDFFLEATYFDIGAKAMIFRWRMRRFHLFHFSCADMFLTDGVDTAKWLAAYLNSFRHIRGGVFHIDDAGHVAWKRRRRHFVAYRDELARWSFRHAVRYRHDPRKNQLIAWVFNYRHETDLDVIPQALRF